MATKNPRDTELETLLERIRQVRNFDFRSYKRGTLQRRIERRMAATRCRSRSAYLALLERDPAELNTLVSSMLIKLTSFFRDPEVWAGLMPILRALLTPRHPEREVRIWCAGCATGEEAYSVAIAAAEILGPAFSSSDLKIFATDADEAAIAYARHGVFTQAQVEGCSQEQLERWFVPTGSGYAVRKELRRVLVFGLNNLVSDAPISRQDLILCRNVFIYLESELQKRVLARFHYALRGHGVLVLGRSELIPYAAKLFEPLDQARRIYRKDIRQELVLPAYARLRVPPEPAEVDAPLAPPGAEGAPDAPGPAPSLRDALEAQPCPLIVTDPEGTVVYWSRSASRLWRRSSPDMLGRRLASLGVPGLTHELLVEQTARVLAGKSEHETADGQLEVPDRPPVTLRAEVFPLRANGETTGLVYVAHDVSAVRLLELSLKKANDELQEVNARLLSANDELRASNEELETTNEELQSANEELQTTNEELQSTNEELETTNEELQSTNAELDAINRELAHRTQEIDALGITQRSIIRALSAAVVVLDAQGHVTVWNLAAERLLGLTEREAVGQTLWSLHVPALRRSLLARLRKRLAASSSVRLEDVGYQLPHGGRGTANVVATPLLVDATLQGAVIVFEDTTRLAALSQQNRALKDRRRR